MPSADVVVQGLRDFLPHLPVRVVASVVYGSVAKGQHHGGSDIDALLITDRCPPGAVRSATAQHYQRFERALGFRPDPLHPVEIFGVNDCRQALGLPVTCTTGTVDTMSGLASEDAWELLYALVTPHRVVVGASVIEELRLAADRRLADLRRSTAPHDSDRR